MFAQTFRVAPRAELGGILPDTKPLNLPAELGKLPSYHEVAQESTHPFIIHIQSAHGHPEAQRKIQTLLNWFYAQADSDKPMTIALEGARGELHPEYLNFLADYPEVNDMLVESLVDQGELTGAELFSWEHYIKEDTTKAKLRFVGVEEPALYRANLEAYRKLLEDEQEIAVLLSAVKADLEKKASNILTPEVFKFIRSREQLKNGRYAHHTSSPQLESYLRYLTGVAERVLAVRLSESFEQIRFPNLHRFLILQELEKSLDDDKAKAQKEDFLNVFSRKSQVEDEIEFVTRLTELRQGDPLREMTQMVWALARNYHIDIRNYGEFWRSIGKGILSHELEAVELFREIEFLEQRLLEAWVKSPEQKAMVESLEQFHHVEKLLNIKITPDEYHYIRGHEEAIRKWIGAEVGAYMDRALEFYVQARRRDHVLLENTLRASQGGPTILISGGFHTPGLTELMREKGIGYGVIQPGLKNAGSRELYIKALREENTSTSKYLESGLLTKQEALYFKTIAEDAPEMLWKKYQLSPGKAGKAIATALSNHPVLGERMMARAKAHSENKAEVRFKVASQNKHTAGSIEQNTLEIALATQHSGIFPELWPARTAGSDESRSGRGRFFLGSHGQVSASSFRAADVKEAPTQRAEIRVEKRGTTVKAKVGESNTEKSIHWLSLVTGIGVVLYGIVLFVDLFSFFQTEPFSYGYVGSFFASAISSGLFVGFLIKLTRFFTATSKKPTTKAQKKKTLKRRLKEAERSKTLLGAFKMVTIISLPIIIISDWGYLAKGVVVGAHTFVDWNFHWLLAAMLGLDLILHIGRKLLGRYEDRTTEQMKRQAHLATAYAPTTEEVLFRFLLFGGLTALFIWVGFKQGFVYTLPFTGISVGFGLPLGAFLALMISANVFFKAHGRFRWFHHWILGAVTAYVLFHSPELVGKITLIPSITIHLLWNFLASGYDYLKDLYVPLKKVKLRYIDSEQLTETKALDELLLLSKDGGDYLLLSIDNVKPMKIEDEDGKEIDGVKLEYKLYLQAKVQDKVRRPTDIKQRKNYIGRLAIAVDRDFDIIRWATEQAKDVKIIGFPKIEEGIDSFFGYLDQVGEPFSVESQKLFPTDNGRDEVRSDDKKHELAGKLLKAIPSAARERIGVAVQEEKRVWSRAFSLRHPFREYSAGIRKVQADASDTIGAFFGGILALGVVVLVIGLLVATFYNVILFFHLTWTFWNNPYDYGLFWSPVTALIITGIIMRFISKVLTFFRGSSDDDDDEEEKQPSGPSDPDEAAILYLVLFGGLTLLGMPYIFWSNWGYVAQGLSLGAHYFTAWNFHYLLGGLLTLSFLIHLYRKATGDYSRYTYGQRIANAGLATGVAPPGEELFFRALFFNFSWWLWVTFLNYSESFTYTLPLLGISVGWELPLGIFIAVAANADRFFKAHGEGKWFHHWFMGAIASYVYYYTYQYGHIEGNEELKGGLFVPIAIHAIWNFLASVFDLIVHAMIPLDGSFGDGGRDRYFQRMQLKANGMISKFTRSRSEVRSIFDQPQGGWYDNYKRMNRWKRILEGLNHLRRRDWGSKAEEIKADLNSWALRDPADLRALQKQLTEDASVFGRRIPKHITGEQLAEQLEGIYSEAPRDQYEDVPEFLMQSTDDLQWDRGFLRATWESSLDNAKERLRPYAEHPRIAPHLPKIKFIIAGGALGIAILIGVVIYAVLAFQMSELWKESKSKADVTAIELYYEAGNARELDAIEQEAIRRHTKITGELEDFRRAVEYAREVGNSVPKVLNNKHQDTPKEAETYAIFDLFVKALASLRENEVSENSEARLGQSTPQFWYDSVADGERAAISDRFEGYLALTLRRMLEEIEEQKRIAQELEGHINEFEAITPVLFGGDMRGSAEPAEESLETFKQSEIAAEQQYQASKWEGMRGRISDRFYAGEDGYEEPDFKHRRDRRDDLVNLYAVRVGPANTLANDIAEHLDDMIQHLNEETAMIALAKQNESVPVPKSEPIYDSEGNQTGTREWIEYEDHSLPYDIAAAAAAAAAKADEKRANEKGKELGKLLRQLQINQMMRQEELLGMLPTQAIGEADAGFFSPIGKFFFGSTLSLIDNADAQWDNRTFLDNFRRDIQNPINRLANTVAGRRDAEINWVDNVIDTELNSQIDRASGNLPAEAPQRPEVRRETTPEPVAIVPSHVVELRPEAERSELRYANVLESIAARQSDTFQGTEASIALVRDSGLLTEEIAPLPEDIRLIGELATASVYQSSDTLSRELGISRYEALVVILRQILGTDTTDEVKLDLVMQAARRELGEVLASRFLDSENQTTVQFIHSLSEEELVDNEGEQLFIAFALLAKPKYRFKLYVNSEAGEALDAEPLVALLKEKIRDLGGDADFVASRLDVQGAPTTEAHLRRTMIRDATGKNSNTPSIVVSQIRRLLESLPAARRLSRLDSGKVSLGRRTFLSALLAEQLTDSPEIFILQDELDRLGYDGKTITAILTGLLASLQAITQSA